MDIVKVKFIAVNDDLILKLKKSPAAGALLSADTPAALSKAANAYISLYLKQKYVGSWGYNEFRKPIADNVFFNISHTLGAVVFVSSLSPVGIDIEMPRQVEKAIVERVLSSCEREYPADFFEHWTSKESLIKAYGGTVVTNLKLIPSLPFEGLKEFNGKTYYCANAYYGGYIISVTREGSTPFTLSITPESVEV